MTEQNMWEWQRSNIENKYENSSECVKNSGYENNTDNLKKKVYSQKYFRKKFEY